MGNIIVFIDAVAFIRKKKFGIFGFLGKNGPKSLLGKRTIPTDEYI